MDHGILFDHARTARIGLPEAVFCEGKPFEALVELLSSFGRGSGHPVLFTRLAPDVFARVPAEIRAEYDYHPLSRTAFGDALPPKGKGRVSRPSFFSKGTRLAMPAIAMGSVPFCTLRRHSLSSPREPL